MIAAKGMMATRVVAIMPFAAIIHKSAPIR
jgi:hypothetical protein